MIMQFELLVSCVLVWNMSAVVACKGGGSEPAAVRSADDETGNDSSLALKDGLECCDRMLQLREKNDLKAKHEGK